ncbi:hypothetical protein RIF29_22194 [Crotalaria pallida]|uniref:Uncharacterized protein n=1 Tax=Crotalaria pallida TaxID=3830 RepID=A0AAN9I7V4_CROPI
MVRILCGWACPPIIIFRARHSGHAALNSDDALILLDLNLSPSHLVIRNIPKTSPSNQILRGKVTFHIFFLSFQLDHLSFFDTFFPSLFTFIFNTSPVFLAFLFYSCSMPSLYT